MSLTNEDITAQNFKDFYDKIFPYLSGSAHAGFTPCGTVIAYFGETAPQNYLICDGSQYNKADYPQLWTLLSSLTNSTAYMVSGDNTKFKVPDLRGEFLRGTGTNRHTNQGSGANVGVHQDGTVHNRLATNASTKVVQVQSDTDKTWFHNINSDSQIYATGTHKWLAQAFSDIGTEDSSIGVTSRPTNTSVLYCIAYKDIYVDARFDYSTDEKVVGIWIDGKPVYQKTVDVSWNIPWNNDNMKGILTGVTPLISNVMLISAIGIGTVSDGIGTAKVCTDLYIQNYSNTWAIFVANSCTINSVVIQYTKTTD